MQELFLTFTGGASRVNEVVQKAVEQASRYKKESKCMGPSIAFAVVSVGLKHLLIKQWIKI